MRPYRIIIHGAFAPKQTADGPKARGFYTARAVVATSAAEAGLEVVRLVASDSRIDEIMVEWNASRPDISVDGVVELQPGDEANSAPLGFILYSDDEADAPDEPGR
jgi:hypothetical protein